MSTFRYLSFISYQKSMTNVFEFRYLYEKQNRRTNVCIRQIGCHQNIFSPIFTHLRAHFAITKPLFAGNFPKYKNTISLFTCRAKMSQTRTQHFAVRTSDANTKDLMSRVHIGN